MTQANGETTPVAAKSVATTVTAPPRSFQARKAAAGMILAILFLASLQLGLGYRSDRQDAEKIVQSAARFLDIQNTDLFLKLEHLLNDLAERIDLSQWPEPTMTRWLQGRLEALPEVDYILVVGLDGHPLGGALSMKAAIDANIDVSQREYYQYHISHPAETGLHIGAPFFSRLDNTDVIPVSRGLFDDQHRLTGIVKVNLFPQALVQNLLMTPLEESGTKMISRDDGLVLARHPAAADPRPADTAIRSHRHLARFPLTVTATISRGEAYAQWRIALYSLGALVTLCAAALLLGATLLDRREYHRALSTAKGVWAEAQATRAHQRLIDALESSADAIAVYDAEDRLVLCNESYRSYLHEIHDIIVPGTPYENILRTALLHGALILSDDESLETKMAEMLAQHRRADSDPALLRRSDGRWFLCRDCRTAEGGVITLRSDVSDIKFREEELDTLHRRYALILDSAGEGIVGIDAQGILTFANAAALRMLGRSSLEGGDYRTVLLGEDGENSGILPAFPLAGSDGGLREAAFSRPQAPPFIAEFILAPIREDDRFQGAVLVFRDISLRKRYEEGIAHSQRDLEQQVAERTKELSAEIMRRALTEQALTKSQARLLGITASLFEGVLLVDPHGHILFANPSAHRLLQVEAGHLSGTELDQSCGLLHQGQRLTFAESPLPQVIASGETIVDHDALLLLSDGKRLPVAYACSPLEEEGKRRAAIISFRSIEILKAAQRESLQASRLASVGQLAAGIAHEINTPVQYIGDNLHFLNDSLGALGEVMAAVRTLLAQGKADGPALAALDDLIRQKDVDYLLAEMPLATTQSLQGVGHVAHIVRSMKEFSHPGSTAKTATDINRAIDSVITVSRTEWKHVAKVETDLDPALPQILCFAAEINQVLLNLLVNAAQALKSQDGGPGTIRISTRLDGPCIEIRVADSGPGIAPEIREKIFDPFFTTKAVGKGTGQGLAICVDVIVNKHGGTLFLDSSVASGACFVIRLPIGAR